MADTGRSGLDALTDRMARARRTVPPPRHPAPPADPTPSRDQDPPPIGESAPATPAPATAPAAQEPPRAVPAPGASGRQGPPARAAQHQPSPPAPPPIPLDEPLANLGLRVRRSLDMRVTHLVHELRRQRMIRTNKTELVEMLLWELPEEPDDDLARRLQRYRLAAPRP